MELYSYLDLLDNCALYCDTDSIIYRHVGGMYNPPLSEFVGDMIDELDGCYITEYVSNGTKNYSYRIYNNNNIFKVQYPMYISIRVQWTINNMGCIIYNNMTIIKF